MTPPAAVSAEALSPKPLRILAVDDQSLFLEALTIVLSSAPDLEVIAWGGDGVQGVELALSLRPDVVLMDVEMPRMDGFEATKRITDSLPETAVVMVTGSGHVADVERACAAGAAAYVTKDQLATSLAASIRAAASRLRPP
jgi:DNA-binding NarL/FixJ family response regulator